MMIVRDKRQGVVKQENEVFGFEDLSYGDVI